MPPRQRGRLREPGRAGVGHGGGLLEGCDLRRLQAPFASERGDERATLLLSGCERRRAGLRVARRRRERHGSRGQPLLQPDESCACGSGPRHERPVLLRREAETVDGLQRVFERSRGEEHGQRIGGALLVERAKTLREARVRRGHGAAGELELRGDRRALAFHRARRARGPRSARPAPSAPAPGARTARAPRRAIDLRARPRRDAATRPCRAPRLPRPGEPRRRRPRPRRPSGSPQVCGFDRARRGTLTPGLDFVRMPDDSNLCVFCAQRLLAAVRRALLACRPCNGGRPLRPCKPVLYGRPHDDQKTGCGVPSRTRRRSRLRLAPCRRLGVGRPVARRQARPGAGRARGDPGDRRRARAGGGGLERRQHPPRRDRGRAARRTSGTSDSRRRTSAQRGKRSRRASWPSTPRAVRRRRSRC